MSDPPRCPAMTKRALDLTLIRVSCRTFGRRVMPLRVLLSARIANPRRRGSSSGAMHTVLDLRSAAQRQAYRIQLCGDHMVASDHAPERRLQGAILPHWIEVIPKHPRVPLSADRAVCRLAPVRPALSTRRNQDPLIRIHEYGSGRSPLAVPSPSSRGRVITYLP